jgi:acetyl-CoA synthetase
MTWSMSLGIVSRRRRSRLHLLSIVSGSSSYDSSPTIDKSILDAVAEAAVVGVSDELTGQAVNAFVSLKGGNEHNDQIKKDLVLQVRKSIGPFAAPKVSNV